MILEVCPCGGEGSNERHCPAYFYFPLFHASIIYTIKSLQLEALLNKTNPPPAMLSFALVYASNASLAFHV